MKKISVWDIEIVHVRGSGPGGQNRNKRMSGVRARHIPTGLVAMATERRSQAQNLEAAVSRLQEKVEAFYFRPAPRRATKKTRSSVTLRLDKKKQTAQTKMMRGKKIGFDD